MAQVRVTPSSNKKWIAIAAAIAALGAAGYWFTSAEDVSDAARVTDAMTAASGAVPGSAAVVPGAEFSNAEPSAQETQAVLEQQKAAARVVEDRPDLKPLTGPITERPDFVSPMEWAMLQGVVQQHAQPDKELTRMVNFLRFMKQMESLEALPRTPQNVAKRQMLSAILIDDLPNRVQQGDLELKDAKARMAEWLVDAVPDATTRQQQSEAMGKRLVAAAEAYKATEAATKGLAPAGQ